MTTSLHSRLVAGIPHIVHGFGRIRERVPAALQPLWSVRPTKTQVHGTGVVEVVERDQRCGHVDGTFTALEDCAISVVTADCAPILLARRDGTRIAALHSGWRGTRGGIVDALWRQLRQLREHPHDWVAAVGPTIRACCYEVAASLVDDFVAAFPRLAPEVISPAPRRLDLQAILHHVLRDLELADVDVLAMCSCCSRDDSGEPQFLSFRRDSTREVMWSGIAISRAALPDRMTMKD